MKQFLKDLGLAFEKIGDKIPEPFRSWLIAISMMVFLVGFVIFLTALYDAAPWFRWVWLIIVSAYLIKPLFPTTPKPRGKQKGPQAMLDVWAKRGIIWDDELEGFIYVDPISEKITDDLKDYPN